MNTMGSFYVMFMSLGLTLCGSEPVGVKPASFQTSDSGQEEEKHDPLSMMQNVSDEDIPAEIPVQISGGHLNCSPMETRKLVCSFSGLEDLDSQKISGQLVFRDINGFSIPFRIIRFHIKSGKTIIEFDNPPDLSTLWAEFQNSEPEPIPEPLTSDFRQSVTDLIAEETVETTPENEPEETQTSSGKISEITCGSTFFSGNAFFTQEVADQWCESQGGRLAGLTGENITEFLVTSGRGKSYWVRSWNGDDYKQACLSLKEGALVMDDCQSLHIPLCECTTQPDSGTFNK